MIPIVRDAFKFENLRKMRLFIMLPGGSAFLLILVVLKLICLPSYLSKFIDNLVRLMCGFVGMTVQRSLSSDNWRA